MHGKFSELREDEQNSKVTVDSCCLCWLNRKKNQLDAAEGVEMKGLI